ncbi:MAG: hypothetical protein RLZZ366_269 [Pseudomonadota bacterium]|jgi:HNH endonuclease
MISAQKKTCPELAQNAARACLLTKPYSMILFERVDGKGTSVFYVGGVEGGPWNAKKALQKAHTKHRGTCFYCKKLIANADFSIDHVEPTAIGGSNSVQNLVICHKACNNDKGRQIIEAYNPQAGKEWLTALLNQIQDRLNKIAPQASSSTSQ